MRGLGLLTAVALAATVGMGGTAFAAGGGKLNPEYHRISSTVGAMSQGTLDGTTCDGKRSILSGGVDLEGAYGTMTAGGYYPIDVDADTIFDTYRAIGDNATGTPIFMGRTNVCAKVQNVAQRGDSQSSPAFQRKKLKATCANNEHVTGGGGYSDAPYDAARMAESAPYDDGDTGSVPDDGWFITIDNFSGSNYTATAYAHCVKDLGGLTYVDKRSKAPASGRLDETVKCAKGEKVIGGGLETDGAGGVGALVTSRHSITAPSDRVWDTALDNDDFEKVPVTSYAICHR